MAQCALSERQKMLLRSIVPGLQKETVKTEWALATGDNRIIEIHGLDPTGKLWQEIWQENIRFADFSDFEACGFLRQVGKDRYHLYGQAIVKASERNFEPPTIPTPTFVSGNQYNVSNVQNSILNVDSALENVQQSIQAAPQVNDAQKQELEKLIADLRTALHEVPEGYQDEIEAIQEQAEQVGKVLSKEHVNKRSLDVSSKGLIEAAKTLQTITPNVLLIATQIANTLAPYL